MAQCSEEGQDSMGGPQTVTRSERSLEKGIGEIKSGVQRPELMNSEQMEKSGLTAKEEI